jgi:cyclopropane fatty-acyl-phospholipid synthase-like methyltransferase
VLHGTGQLARLLELGSGPAWHSTAAAASLQCRAVAVDNSPAMNERAKERVAEMALGGRA